ncbi:PH domain-containing protein [Myxococcaceae bacterium GXIMD 01537]
MTDGGSPPAPVASVLLPPGEVGLAHLPAVLRPHGNLLTYYLLSAFRAGPAFPILMAMGFFKFQTLRYEFDEEGLTVRWGILFRREVSLTYARIQDIHLSSNVVERWLGLARVQVQTASGNAHAEVTLEGLQAFEAMRDFLYSRMPGARGEGTGAAREATGTRAAEDLDALTAALREVAAEVRALRLGLGTGSPPPEKPDA